jgi:hypothetical protein
MIGNTAEARPYCSSVSDTDSLRVFICSPLTTSECDVQTVATLEIYTKYEKN